MSGFIKELHDRKIGRTAAIYGAIAWLIIQAAANVFVALRLPSWSLYSVMCLLLAGFPIILMRAWNAQNETGSTYRRRVFLLLIAGLIISFAIGFLWLPRASRFMAQAKLPTDHQVEHKVREVIACHTGRSDADSISGSSPLHGPGQNSLGLDGPTDSAIILDLNMYIQGFQSKHMIDMDIDYAPLKRVVDLSKLVKSKLKPDLRFV